jgi:hypothetical protein
LMDICDFCGMGKSSGDMCVTPGCRSNRIKVSEATTWGEYTAKRERRKEWEQKYKDKNSLSLFEHIPMHDFSDFLIQEIADLNERFEKSVADLDKIMESHSKLKIYIDSIS